MTINGKNKIKKLILYLIAVLWMLWVWDIGSVMLFQKYATDFALPNVKKTLIALFSLIKTADYWTTIILSVLHVLLGLLIGACIGVILSVIVYRFRMADTLLSPIMTVIRSTPVISFILILWVVLANGKNIVPSVVSAIMVTPVVYGQVHVGFQTLDKNNMEMLELFGVKGKRKLKDFVLPSLLPHFFTSLLTCAGLAWKAGVSAEVIVYASNTIGQKISDAKAFGDTPELFALTLSVILLSVLFEKIILKLKKEVTKHEH